MKAISRSLWLGISLVLVMGCSAKTDKDSPSSKKDDNSLAVETAGQNENANGGTDTAQSNAPRALLPEQPSQMEIEILPPAPRLTKSKECPNNAGKTKDGLCSCTGLTYSNGSISDFIPDGSEVLGKSFECITRDEWSECGDSNPISFCNDIKGCMTLDGRWYSPLGYGSGEDGSIRVENTLGNVHVLKEIMQSANDYYVPGGMDVTLESQSIYGDCVLDRTDGIPLYSTNVLAETFACDQPICSCGTGKCKNGELCQNGKCQQDNAKPIELTDENSGFAEYQICIAGAGCRMDGPVGEKTEECRKNKSPLCKVSKICDDEDDCEFTPDTLFIRSFKAEQCPGGKRYCHGKGHFPLPLPQNPNGYQCLTVEEFPGFKSNDSLKAWTCTKEDGCLCGGQKCSKNAACVNETCLCGTTTIPENYVCDVFCTDGKCNHIARGLRCDQASCTCGSTNCMKGEICKDGQCLCDDAPSLGADYTCKQRHPESPKQKHLSPKRDLVCQNPNGCKCGNTTCPANARCDDNTCYCDQTFIPDNQSDFACTPAPTEKQPNALALTCNAGKCDCFGKKISKGETCHSPYCGRNFVLTDKGCTCNGELTDTSQYMCATAKEAKHVRYCVNEKGCKCDQKTCPYMTVCQKGECVDRISLKPIPAGYDISNGLPLCTSETGCACGKTTCENGKHCLNGTCYRDPYNRKIGSKILYYRFSNPDDQNQFEENKADHQNVFWSLMFEDPNKPICEYEEEFFSGIKSKYTDDDLKTTSIEFYFNDNRTDAQNLRRLCESPKYRQMTIGEFLKNCGTGPVPKDVAVKYCYFRFIQDEDECFSGNLLEYSGWQDEDYTPPN